jgi:hypothetical protein
MKSQKRLHWKGKREEAKIKLEILEDRLIY